MVPVSKYATVPASANLAEAVAAIRRSQETENGGRYPHRAVLIYDDTGDVIGKVSQMDILRGLEPKYEEMLGHQNSLCMGFTPRFQRMMIEQFGLWDAPLNDICRKSATRNVRAFMHAPDEGEFVGIDATLDEAIHRFVMCSHQSLLVTEGRKIVGILRLTDIFAAVAAELESCPIPD